MTDYPDTLSYPNAMKLKMKIEDFWWKRGLQPKIKVVIQEKEGQRPIYVIRSNITFDERGYPTLIRERLT